MFIYFVGQKQNVPRETFCFFNFVYKSFFCILKTKTYKIFCNCIRASYILSKNVSRETFKTKKLANLGLLFKQKKV